MTASPCSVGIDIGATNIKAVCVTSEGHELARTTVPTPVGREKLIDGVRGVLAGFAELSAQFLGVSSPGLAARDGRSIGWMRGRSDAVQGLDWSEALGRDDLVPVLNDAHAATLGEAWQGAARGCDDVVLLTLGTGIGGGIVVGGKLLRGHLGRAGHLGHLCLDIDGPPDICRTPGSFEEAVADCGVHRRSAGRFSTTEEVVKAAAQGDARAADMWARSIRALACGIASIANAVDPGIVVLGGGIATAGDALFRPLARQLDEVEWRPTGFGVRVVPAELGNMAGAFGAARNAYNSHMRGSSEDAGEH